MRLWLAFAIAVLAITLLPGSLSPARAEGIEVRSQTVQNRFPDGIQITLFAVSNADINSIRLRYRLLPDGSTTFGRPQCTGTTAVNCSLSVGASSAVFLVPGVEVVYNWELGDAAGNSLETPEQTHVY